MFEQESLQVKEYLEQYSKVYIFRHQRPDGDAIGSQIGLLNILRTNYPESEIIAVNNLDTSDFAYLEPEEIEINDNKIVNSLIFILDTANVERIEGNYKAINDITNRVVKIDHHPNFEKYGHINIVENGLSSTSELVYEIFVTNLGLNLNTKGACAIYSGIFSDTGGFAYSSTTSRTLEISSELVKFNFNYEDLMLSMKELDGEIIRILGWMYSNIQIQNGLGIIKFDKRILREQNFNKSKISMLVGYLGIYKDLKVWILMVSHDNFIRVNLRSKRDIDISKIANKFNGGGHKNASGARVYSWDEAEELINEVKKIM